MAKGEKRRKRKEKKKRRSGKDYGNELASGFAIST